MGNVPKLLLFKEAADSPVVPMVPSDWLEAMHSLIKDPSPEEIDRFIHLCTLNDAKLQKYPEVRANLDYRIDKQLDVLQQTCEAPDKLIDFYFDVFKPGAPPHAMARETEHGLARDGSELGIISRDGERTVKPRHVLMEEKRAREAVEAQTQREGGGTGTTGGGSFFGR